MNKEDKRFINNVKKIIKQNYVDDEDDVIGIFIKLINLIQKQDKIINDIKFITYNNKPHITQEKLIEYFKKVVDENVKD